MARAAGVPWSVPGHTLVENLGLDTLAHELARRRGGSSGQVNLPACESNIPLNWVICQIMIPAQTANAGT